MGEFLRRHWLSLCGLIGACALIFCVGFGFGQGWGSDQWGPFSEWLAGALTLGAVVVALRESLRGQRARLVDHEYARRRECLKALGDVWGGLTQIGMEFLAFKNFLDELPMQFDATDHYWDSWPPEGPPSSLGDKITDRLRVFMTRWVEHVEPPLFVARALLHDTRLNAAVNQISADIKKINNEIVPAMTEVMISEYGRRPDTKPFDDAWKRLMSRRDEHLKLALEHFSLSLDDVQRAALRGRQQ